MGGQVETHCYAVVGYNSSNSLPFEVYKLRGAQIPRDGLWVHLPLTAARSMACSTPTLLLFPRDFAGAGD